MIKNTDKAQKTKWYKTTWGKVLLGILFFPYGLYLVWRKTNWDMRVRKAITGVVIVIAVIQIISSFSTPSYGDGIKKAQEEARIARIQATATPTSVPVQVEKLNIQVTSQIVKKVNGKYRYFFDIRNKDTKNFEGSVSITLYNQLSGNALGGDTFNTNKPIESGLGSSQYIDIYTGPVSVDGANGISKFKFTVKNKDGQIVNEGSGEISSKLDDLDNF